MLDTLRRVETPEGVALELRPAGVVPRAAAWALDFIIRFAALWLLSIGLVLLGAAGEGLYLIALFALMWLYPIAFELLWDGQTPGKRALGLRVVRADGMPVGALPSAVRNLLRVVDALPLFYGFGVTASLLDPQGRRIGDWVAGTLVVHVDRAQAVPALPRVPVVVPPRVLALPERAAIVAFAERAPQLTEERQRELADLLSPLTGARAGPGVQRLLGMAAALVGRR